MTEKRLPIPQMDESSWGEAFLQTVHNAVSISSFPIIAPTICLLLNEKIRDLGKKRIDDFIMQIIDYVKFLNKETLNTDDFIISTEIAIKKIVNEHNKTKRDRFSKIYKDFIINLDLDRNPSIETFEIFLSIASVLSDNALYTLLILKDVGLAEPFSADSNMNNKFQEFNRRAKEKCGEHFYYRAMAELEQTGVATQASGFWSGNTPFVTQLGLDFLQWIESDSK